MEKPLLMAPMFFWFNLELWRRRNPPLCVCELFFFSLFSFPFLEVLFPLATALRVVTVTCAVSVVDTVPFDGFSVFRNVFFFFSFLCVFTKATHCCVVCQADTPGKWCCWGSQASVSGVCPPSVPCAGPLTPPCHHRFGKTPQTHRREVVSVPPVCGTQVFVGL